MIYEQSTNKEALLAQEKEVLLKRDFKSHIELAERSEREGHLMMAYKYYIESLEVNPNSEKALLGFIRLGAKFTINPITQNIIDLILKAENHPGIVELEWLKCTMNLLCSTPDFKELLVTANQMQNLKIEFTDPPHELEEQLLKLAVNIGQNPIWIKALEHSFFTVLRMEKIFTVLRKTILRWWFYSEKHIKMLEQETISNLLCALALQCFWNEHIYFQTPKEKSVIDWLKTAVEEAIENNNPIASQVVALLVCYCDILTLKNFHKLKERQWIPALESALKLLIDNPIKEQSYNFTALTKISDSISQKVRSQYESHPYPRWKHASPPKPPNDTLSERISKTTGIKLAPLPKNANESPSVLIAGCGTGRQLAYAAIFYKNSKILAIDLSLASLGYAKRKIDEMGLNNIEFAQADILEIESLNRKFDIIESAGVLHHLDDPIKGTRALCKCLKSGGVLNFGLYSKRARQDILVFRKQIKNFDNISDDTIREYREIIKEKMLNGDTTATPMTTWCDFYSLSQFRDMLFHVKEHSYTLSQIKNKLLIPNNLVFKGFSNLSPKVNASFLKYNNNIKSCFENIDAWDRFEKKERDTFIGMYNFWAQKK